MRYEGDLGTTERFNRSVAGFDANATSPIAAAAQAAYAKNPVHGGLAASQFQVKGGLLFAGQNGKYIYNTKRGYFSPRFGFAWTPGGSGKGTVIRAGYGRVRRLHRHAGRQPARLQLQQHRARLRHHQQPAAGRDAGQSVPHRHPAAHRASAAGLGTFLGQSITFYNPNPLNPYSIRWNFDIQRSIGKGMVFEIGYTGNHAVHLPIDQSLNYTPAQYLSTSPFRDQAVIDRNSTNVANPFAGLLPGTNLNGTTVGFTQLAAAVPAVHRLTTAYDERIQRRQQLLPCAADAVGEALLANGFQFLANYQWGRTIAQRQLPESVSARSKSVPPISTVRTAS